MKPLQFKNQIISRIKFLKLGMVLYTPIKNIKKELSVNAKYWPQCIPIESIPDLSNSDFTKIKNDFNYFRKLFINLMF